jgi:hypothetical protein
MNGNTFANSPLRGRRADAIRTFLRRLGLFLGPRDVGLPAGEILRRAEKRNLEGRGPSLVELDLAEAIHSKEIITRF